MTGQQTTWRSNVEHDPVHQAAVEWYLRLRQSEVRDEDTLAWQRWMLEDPKHAQAFTRIDEVSQVLNEVNPPDIAPLGEWRSPRPVLTWAIAASVVVAVTVAVMLSLGKPAQTLRTAVAENRTLQLADGSQVTLGGRSEIKVTFGEDRRSIELKRGEALFSVAKDATRPFEVRAGDATVIAVGTQFNVRRRLDRVDVAVIEGRVVVEPHTKIFGSQQRPVSLAAGEQTTARGEDIQAAAPLPDPATTTAWKTGRLPYRLEPLRYVVEDVNRYLNKPIVIEDAAAGDLPFTGTVMSDNVTGWIGSLESIFGLRAVEEADRIVLRRTRPGIE